MSENRGSDYIGRGLGACVVCAGRLLAELCSRLVIHGRGPTPCAHASINSATLRAMVFCNIAQVGLAHSGCCPFRANCRVCGRVPRALPWADESWPFGPGELHVLRAGWPGPTTRGPLGEGGARAARRLAWADGLWAFGREELGAMAEGLTRG